MPAPQRAAATAPVLELWHGAQRWTHPPEIRPQRKGHYEAGPGIYLTTRYETARKYAKGGGSVLRIELAADLRWLDAAKLPVDTLREFVDGPPRLPRHRDIHADLDRTVERMGTPLIAVSTLVNLAFNWNALGGQAGIRLATWLTERGIDAALEFQNRNEDWVVVFNPKVIRLAVPTPAAQVDAMSGPDFPPVKVQLARLAAAPGADKGIAFSPTGARP